MATSSVNSAIKINYPGANNISQLSYDGNLKCTKIVEIASGSVSSTYQFSWGNGRRLETRDASGARLFAFFKLGELHGADTFFYSVDALQSTREFLSSSGAIVDASYEPFGQQTTPPGAAVPNFGFARYYCHQRSGLNFTETRAFSSRLGRWLSRDSVAKNVNPYVYVHNKPLGMRDPSGCDEQSDLCNKVAQTAASAAFQECNGDDLGAKTVICAAFALVVYGVVYKQCMDALNDADPQNDPELPPPQDKKPQSCPRKPPKLQIINYSWL